MRYIHNNPVRAGIVKKAENYRWSTHSAYLDNNPTIWLTTDWVLLQFAERREAAIKNYQSFIQQGEEEGHRKDLSSGTSEGRILGDESFVETSLAKASQRMITKLSLEQILQVICEYYDIGYEDLISKSRQRHIAKPRAVAALLVREQEHLSLMDLSRKLNRDLSGLSQAAGRLDKKLKGDNVLILEVEKTKELLR